MGRLIQLLKIYIGLSQADCIHTTADINTDDIRHCLICHSHSRTYCAALSCVHIGHDPDSAPCCELVIAHTADLIDRLLLYHRGIADRCIDLSLNLKHTFLRPPFSKYF